MIKWAKTSLENPLFHTTGGEYRWGTALTIQDDQKVRDVSNQTSNKRRKVHENTTAANGKQICDNIHYNH